MCCEYFIMAVMSIPTMLLFSSGHSTNGLEVIDKEYESKTDLIIQGIAMLSLGNMGDSHLACGQGIYTLNEFRESEASIDLTCPQGRMTSLATFGQVPSV